VEVLRTHRAKGRLVVVALAAATMLAAPLALLHSGAATAAATEHVALSGPRTTTSSTASIGDTVPLAHVVKARPATPAQRARHQAALRHAQAVWHNELIHAAHVHHANEVRAAEAHFASEVAHASEIRRQLATPRAASVRGTRPAHHAVTEGSSGRSRVGIATWYAWHPGQCASPFLPHGTLLTVTDLATHKTIQCLVTDTEAHNPGRVVDLSQYCFEELGALSQGVILVRITW
jgi:rare lipoprotein A (peptidoglycan hydrolase)